MEWNGMECDAATPLVRQDKTRQDRADSLSPCLPDPDDETALTDGQQ